MSQQGMGCRWGFRAVVACSCLLAGVALVSRLWCTRALSWVAADGARFMVIANEQLIHTYSYFVVVRNNGEQRVLLDDDARLGEVKLVRWDDWLLVVNDHLVLGGFNFATEHMYGENQWDRLPMTRWHGEGQVVGTRRFGKHATVPAGFPQ